RRAIKMAALFHVCDGKAAGQARRQPDACPRFEFVGPICKKREKYARRSATCVMTTSLKIESDRTAEQRSWTRCVRPGLSTAHHVDRSVAAVFRWNFVSLGAATRTRQFHVIRVSRGGVGGLLVRCDSGRIIIAAVPIVIVPKGDGHAARTMPVFESTGEASPS